MEKNRWSNIFKVLLFGGLSFFFGEVQLYIPGIEIGLIDLREILLLISVFYFPHWFYLILIIFITSLGIPYGPTLWVLISMHIAAIIPVFYLNKLIQSKTKNIYLQGSLYFFVILSYYFVIMYPTYALMSFLLKLSPYTSIFEHYSNSIRNAEVEVMSSAILPSLVLIIHQFKKELQNNNKELVVAKNKAEESDRLKTAFLNNLSHEIRTPLNGIVGFASLLTEEHYSKVETNQFKVFIQENTDHLLKLIDRIIDISKFEAGESQNEPVWTKFSTILEAIKLESNENKILNLKKQVELKVTFDPKFNNQLIYIDPVHFSEIVSNLLHNAIKFTDEGEIEVTFKLKNEKTLFLKVRDTGIGIPEKEKHNIFSRFYRGDTDDTSIRGIGLGLAITKEIVDLINGNIWFESSENKGSVFYVEIPVKLKRAEPTEHKVYQNSVPLTTHSNNAKVLVAEDDDINYFYLQEILKKENLVITRALNGYEAVEIMQENADFSLILMDIKMPLLDGISATKLIRDFNKEIPIIAQTAYAMFNNKKAAMNAGCSDYLTKPIPRKKLIKAIRNYIKQEP